VTAEGSPLVSAVIPTRDRPSELSRAVKSALAQRDVDLEVVVIDDHSASSAAEASALDPRARVLRLPANRGVAGARNAGIAAARGEWVAFLDDDDEWAPWKLKTQLQALEATGASWAWCAASLVSADGRVAKMAAPQADAVARLLRVENAVSGSASSVIASKALLERLGGFDEALAHVADWDMWLRLADAAPGVGCPEELVIQHIHPGGMHSRDTDAAFAEFARLRRRHPGISGAAYMRWIAGNHWRAGRRRRALSEYVRGRVLYRARRSGR
jgi:glycosyltransferase involved in cell wall biosynthesis